MPTFPELLDHHANARPDALVYIWLGEGETITQTYTITVDDGEGGSQAHLGEERYPDDAQSRQCDDDGRTGRRTQAEQLVLDAVASEAGASAAASPPVASTAAFQPLPWFATYAAGKAFVLHLSEALAVELRPYQLCQRWVELLKSGVVVIDTGDNTPGSLEGAQWEQAGTLPNPLGVVPLVEIARGNPVSKSLTDFAASLAPSPEQNTSFFARLFRKA